MGVMQVIMAVGRLMEGFQEVRWSRKCATWQGKAKEWKAEKEHARCTSSCVNAGDYSAEADGRLKSF